MYLRSNSAPRSCFKSPCFRSPCFKVRALKVQALKVHALVHFLVHFLIRTLDHGPAHALMSKSGNCQSCREFPAAGSRSGWRCKSVVQLAAQGSGNICCLEFQAES
jgi:hypothetical protein